MLGRRIKKYSFKGVSQSDGVGINSIVFDKIRTSEINNPYLFISCLFGLGKHAANTWQICGKYVYQILNERIEKKREWGRRGRTLS